MGAYSRESYKIYILDYADKAWLDHHLKMCAVFYSNVKGKPPESSVRI